MGQFIDQLVHGPTEIADYFTLWELLVALGLSFVLCTVVAWVYRATHRGVSYSQSFTATTVILGVTVAVIMLIIGSNIARAFTLVGALSIVRFRNAVKETRDVGFIFLVMAIGMAAGTRFYGTAVVFTLFICTVIYAMFALNMFANPQAQRILRVHLPEGLDPHTAFDDVFYRHLASHTLLSVESVRQGLFLEAVYSVVLKKGVSERELIDEIRKVNGNAKVALTHAETVNV